MNYKFIMRTMRLSPKAKPTVESDEPLSDDVGPGGQENWSDSLEARELAHKVAGKLFVDVRTVLKALRGERVRGVCGMRIKKELSETLDENMKLKAGLNG